MLACKRGHEEVVRVLLTAGAELHQKDSRGRTARDTASKRNHDKILAMLNPAKQMRLMQVRAIGQDRCPLCFTLMVKDGKSFALSHFIVAALVMSV